MGIAVESLSISLEKRYIGFNIIKEIDGSVSGNIQVSIGYYDTEHGGGWLSVKDSTIRLNNDALNMVFSMKPSQLGLTDPMLVQSIDTVIYGIISGQIKLTSQLHVTIKDKDGKDLNGIVTLSRQGVILSQQYATGVLDFNVDVILGATVTIEVPGYDKFTKTYTALQGVNTLDAVLTLTPVPAPAAP